MSEAFYNIQMTIGAIFLININLRKSFSFKFEFQAWEYLKF